MLIAQLSLKALLVASFFWGVPKSAWVEEANAEKRATEKRASVESDAFATQSKLAPSPKAGGELPIQSGQGILRPNFSAGFGLSALKSGLSVGSENSHTVSLHFDWRPLRTEKIGLRALYYFGRHKEGTSQVESQRDLHTALLMATGEHFFAKKLSLKAGLGLGSGLMHSRHQVNSSSRSAISSFIGIGGFAGLYVHFRPVHVGLDWTEFYSGVTSDRVISLRVGVDF